MRGVCLAALLLASLVGCTGAPATAPVTGRSFEESFETHDPLPDGWTRAAGTWTLVDEPTAPQGDHVVEHRGGERGSYSFLLADGKGTFDDVRVTAQLRLVGGDDDVTGGVLVRYIDATHYYALRLSHHDGEAVLVKFDGGPTESAERARRHFPLGAWTAVEVEASGANVTVRLDGQEAISFHDRRPLQVGYVGLWVEGSGVTQFDQVKVARR